MCFHPAPAFGQMRGDSPSGEAQYGAASEHHRSQRGRFAIAGQADGALERAEQIEQQDRLKAASVA